MRNVITYIDCSNPGDEFTPDRFQELSYQNMSALYEDAMGRRLDWEHSVHPALGIIKLPEPLGFSVFTVDEVTKGDLLCYYGGKKTLLNNLPCNSSYTLIMNQPHRRAKSIAIDAEKFGELGALVAYMPKDFDKLKEEVGFEGGDLAMANVDFSHKDGDIVVYASCDIPQYSMLGADYGLEYWLSLQEAPIFLPPKFLQSELDFDCSSQVVFQRPILYLRDIENPNMTFGMDWSDVEQEENTIITISGMPGEILYTQRAFVMDCFSLRDKSKLLLHVDAKKISMSDARKLSSGASDSVIVPMSIFAKDQRSFGPYRDFFMYAIEPKEGCNTGTIKLGN